MGSKHTKVSPPSSIAGTEIVSESSTALLSTIPETPVSQIRPDSSIASTTAIAPPKKRWFNFGKNKNSEPEPVSTAPLTTTTDNDDGPSTTATTEFSIDNLVGDTATTSQHSREFTPTTVDLDANNNVVPGARQLSTFSNPLPNTEIQAYKASVDSNGSEIAFGLPKHNTRAAKKHVANSDNSRRASQARKESNPGPTRDPYNPRLRTYAPPVYIDLGGRYGSGSCSGSGGGGGRGRNCASPTDRLKHVDIIEELCYYTPGEPQPPQAYDYYNQCECGELEFVAEGPCCPQETPSNPVTYSKKQRFHFNPMTRDEDEDDDGPPFAWAGDNRNKDCRCKCCTGARGRDPRCQCNCCCTGKARRANSYDELPVGRHRRDTADTDDCNSAGDNDKCADLVPTHSGIYYFDANQKSFVPHDPDPEVVIEESVPVEMPSPPPPAPRRAAPCADTTTILQPILQSMMNPCNPCNPYMGMGGMGMNGMGMNGMSMNGMGMNGMGMNGMGMMGGCGMGMGGMGGMGGCMPPGCTLPIVMMPNCQQQPAAAPAKVKKDKKKKKKKKSTADTVIDFETEPSYSYGYSAQSPSVITPEVVTVRSPPIFLVPEPYPVSAPEIVSTTVITRDKYSPPASSLAPFVGTPSSRGQSGGRRISFEDEQERDFAGQQTDGDIIAVQVQEGEDETVTTVLIPPGVEGDVEIASPEGNNELGVKIEPPTEGPGVDCTDITICPPEGFDAPEVEITEQGRGQGQGQGYGQGQGQGQGQDEYDEEEEDDDDEEEETYQPLIGSKTFQFQPSETNAYPPKTA